MCQQYFEKLINNNFFQLFYYSLLPIYRFELNKNPSKTFLNLLYTKLIFSVKPNFTKIFVKMISRKKALKLVGVCAL